MPYFFKDVREIKTGMEMNWVPLKLNSLTEFMITLFILNLKNIIVLFIDIFWVKSLL